MQVPLLDLKKQYTLIQEEIEQAVKEVLRGGHYILGPNVEALEEEVAGYCGTSCAVGVASGTDALRLALLSAGIGEGDEVITTPFTFIATVEAITQVGAKPVFVDIEEDTFNINIEKIEHAVTDRAKAVLPVHLFGHSVDMGRLLQMAEKYNLLVIEDAAQSFGSECNVALPGEDTCWRRAGSIGDVGCFSFFPTKNLGGVGDGGMVVTDNEDIARKVRLLRVHGGDSGSYCYELPGYNSRLDELQAAVLRVKLKYVDEWIQKRAKKASLYQRFLCNTPVITPSSKPYAKHSFCVYTIKSSVRDKLKKFLRECGVGTKVYYPILANHQKMYKNLGCSSYSFPVAERVCRKVLSLPLYPELEEEKIQYIAQKIAAFFENR